MLKITTLITMPLITISLLGCQNYKHLRQKSNEDSVSTYAGLQGLTKEELGIRNVSQSFNVPSDSAQVRLSRYQPKLGGFIGSAPHDLDPRDGIQEKDSVLAWLGDNSMMLYALTHSRYSKTAATMGRVIFKKIMKKDVRGGNAGEFQDGRILSLKSLKENSIDPSSLQVRSPKIIYFDEKCGPSTDAKAMIGIAKFAADTNNKKKAALIEQMIVDQHKNFMAGKDPRTCNSGSEQGTLQHDYTRASSLAFHLMNTVELFRMNRIHRPLIKETFYRLQELRQLTGARYRFPNGGLEGALGQSIILYSLKRASDIVKDDLGRDIRAAYNNLYNDLSGSNDIKNDKDTQVMGWFLLAAKSGDVVTHIVRDNLLKNHVCVGGGGFSFVGKYGKQGVGPVEDMAMGMAALGSLRAKGLYAPFRSLCQ